jgi:hypothetical protein
VPLRRSPGRKLHAAGDSITFGFNSLGPGQNGPGYMKAPGGLRDQMLVQVGPIYPTVSVTKSSAAISVTSSSSGIAVSLNPTSQFPNYTDHGENGIGIQWLSDHYANFIGNFGPIDDLVLQPAINDLSTAMDPATHLAVYGAVMDRVKSENPNAQILCVGCLVWTELWSTTPLPAHLTGFGNLNTNYIDADIAALCAARSPWAEYCNLADMVLAQEMLLNTPEPGLNPGPLTSDGVHPLLSLQQRMSAEMMKHFSF